MIPIIPRITRNLTLMFIITLVIGLITFAIPEKVYSQPAISVSPSGSGWTSSNVSPRITVQGAISWSYRIETNGSWGSFITGPSSGSTTVTFSSTGTYRIQVHAMDSQGFMSSYTTDYYRIDKTGPVHISSSIGGAYQDGDNFWVRTGTNFTITMRGRDDHSGLSQTNVRLYRTSTDEIRSRYFWSSRTLDNYNTSSNMTVVSAATTYSSGTIREVTFTLRANTHNQAWQYSRYYLDNANNVNGWVATSWYVRTDGVAPTINLSASTNANGTVTASWSLSDAQSGVSGYRYRIETDGSWGSYTSYTSSSSGSVTLPIGAVYRVQVEAQDNVGNTGSSTTGTIDLGAPPTPGSITYPTDVFSGDSVPISWSSSTRATNYRVEVRYYHPLLDGSGWTNYSLLTNTSGTSTTWTPPTGYEQFQIRVRAENSAGSSSYRTGNIGYITTIIPPATPGSFTSPTSTVYGGSGININWGAISNWGLPTHSTNHVGQPIDHRNYRLEVQYNGGTWTLVGNTGTTASRSNFTLSTNTAHTTVRFRVRAENQLSNSDWRYSSTLDIIHPPATPGSITYPAEVTSGNNVSISWGVAARATNYRVEVRYYHPLFDGSGWTTYSLLTTTSGTSTTWTPPAGYEQFQIRVRAENVAGNSSYREGLPGVMLNPPAVPGSFTSPTSTVYGGNGINVSWGSISNWGNPTTTTGPSGQPIDQRTYRLEVQYNGGAWSLVGFTGTANSSTVTVSTNTTHTTVRFRVRAENASSSSDWRYSSTLDIIHPPATPGSITYPTDVKTGDEVTIMWSATARASLYRVEVRYYHPYLEGSGWTNYTLLTTTTAITTTWTAPAGYEQYQFRVRAENVAGNSSYREGPQGFITYTVPPVTPGTFTSPTSTVYGNTQTNISWGGTSSWGIPAFTENEWGQPIDHRNYRLEVQYNGGTWTLIGNTGTTANRSNYTLSANTAHTTVRFRVRAENQLSQSDWRYSSTLTIIHDPNPPTVSIWNDPGHFDGLKTWFGKSTRVFIDAVDNQSGLNGVYYLWIEFTSYDELQPPALPIANWNFIKTTTERTSLTSTRPGDGEWVLWVSAIDNAGNVSNPRVRVFNFDFVDPVIEVWFDGERADDYHYHNVLSTILTADPLGSNGKASGVSEVRYIWARTDEELPDEEDWMVATILPDRIDYHLQEPGNWHLHVRVYDAARNTVEYVSALYRVSGGLSVVTVTPHQQTQWTQARPIVEVEVNFGRNLDDPPLYLVWSWIEVRHDGSVSLHQDQNFHYPGNWGPETFTIRPPGDGEWYLEMYVLTRGGNRWRATYKDDSTIQSPFGPFRVDSTPPRIVATPSSGTNIINVELTVTDAAYRRRLEYTVFGKQRLVDRELDTLIWYYDLNVSNGDRIYRIHQHSMPLDKEYYLGEWFVEEAWSKGSGLSWARYRWVTSSYTGSWINFPAGTRTVQCPATGTLPWYLEVEAQDNMGLFRREVFGPYSFTQGGERYLYGLLEPTRVRKGETVTVYANSSESSVSFLRPYGQNYQGMTKSGSIWSGSFSTEHLSPGNYVVIVWDGHNTLFLDLEVYEPQIRPRTRLVR